jgi:hypothetical protein
MMRLLLTVVLFSVVLISQVDGQKQKNRDSYLIFDNELEGIFSSNSSFARILNCNISL